MKLNQLPHPVLVRLMELDEQAAMLAEQADKAGQQLDHARALLNGQAEDSRVDLAQLRQDFERLLKDSQDRRRRADSEQRVLSNCKVWLERLPPDGTAIEPVAVAIDGHDLASVRSRLKTAEDEITTLNAAPVPSPDIRDRLAIYVKELARQATPVVRGIGANEQLDIRWPLSRVANRINQQGMDTTTANPLLLFASLFPERMLDHLLAVVEQAAGDPLPVIERPARVAALNGEIERLRRIEEALVTRAIERGECVTRDSGAPSWAVLGVKEVNVVNKRDKRDRRVA